jgi:predicted transcriptional regulator
MRRDNPVYIAYEKNYVRAQYAWVQMLTEHLADCSRVFAGDLQSMLILAIVGQSYLSKLLQSNKDIELDQIPVLEDASINASSLSEILGIPRETVRRKLEDLAAKGWIERHNGGWRLVVKDGQTTARQGLAALDQRSMERIAKLVASFNALAKSSA